MGRNGLQKKQDLFGTSLVNESGDVEKILKRCPHCGMVDYRSSAQSADRAHWNIWTVGNVRNYQCGKCKKHFYTLELQVPLDMEPTELYKEINSVFSQASEDALPEGSGADAGRVVTGPAAAEVAIG